eukprot:5811689-Pyramimonas_sp.AAC.1
MQHFARPCKPTLQHPAAPMQLCNTHPAKTLQAPCTDSANTLQPPCCVMQTRGATFNVMRCSLSASRGRLGAPWALWSPS